MDTVKLEDLPLITLRILSHPKPLEMFFAESSPNEVIGHGDVKSKCYLVALKLDQNFEDISQGTIFLNCDIIKVGGSVLE